MNQADSTKGRLLNIARVCSQERENRAAVSGQGAGTPWSRQRGIDGIHAGDSLLPPELLTEPQDVTGLVCHQYNTSGTRGGSSDEPPERLCFPY